MLNFKAIDVSIDEKNVAHVVLNTPEKRNALSSQMLSDLTEMAEELGAMPKVKAVVLSGAGDVFCAGGDLEWMKAQVNADRETRIREAGKLAMMLNSLNEMPKPVIGKIHGGAFGGGIGMACICDVAIADTSTKFGFTESRLGLIPATISPYVLARMGEGKARRVFMSGRIFDASEAAELGIIAKVVTPNKIDEAIEAEVKPYLTVAPGAVASAKQLARSLGPRIDKEVIHDTCVRLADNWETDEAAEGIDAFFERRKANWI